MNLSKLFSTQKEINQAIETLGSLSDNNDWQFLVNILQAEIDELSENILGTHFDNLEQENYLKLKRDYLIILSQLPDKIVKALKEGDDEIPEFDPYPRRVEEIKQKE